MDYNERAWKQGEELHHIKLKEGPMEQKMGQESD
jgi:hypothetical protein